MTQETMPSPVQDAAAWKVEARGIEPVPDRDRRGRPSDLTWIWASANVQILLVAYGAYLVAFYGLNLWQAALAAIVGTVLSYLLVGFIGVAGKHGGAPTLILSRAAFGVRGNIVPNIVSYLLLVGWEIIQLALAVLAAEVIVGRLGLPTGRGVLVIAFVVCIVIAVAVSMLGHATIMKVQRWCTYTFGALSIVLIAVELPKIDWTKVGALPSGSVLGGFIGGTSIVMAGLGIGYINMAADYSRYLPRQSSSRGVVGWTTIGASVPAVLLVVLGVLLAAKDSLLANAQNPVSEIAGPLPTWFLVPYLITAVGGLVSVTVIDLYSSGLNLLALGVRIPRYKSVLIDSALVIAGVIYVVFFSPSFFAPFEGFLITLGVPIAAWGAVFVADLYTRRRTAGYDDHDLYTVHGRYGSVNIAGLGSMVAASAIGLGLVTSTSPVFSWTGYLLRFFPASLQVSLRGSSIGLIVAFVLGGVFYLVADAAAQRRRPQTHAAAVTAE